MAPFQVTGERSFVEISKQNNQVCRRKGVVSVSGQRHPTNKVFQASSFCRDVDMQVRGLHLLAAYQAQ